ncbi:hypothetical protein SD70_21660 [Gordoniibacillus kamchatkensis]|uniref:Uncharacterized protein n=1 Tax=Gordoniibacillus kamchatkensis TaxID=1590651 RepID=A0ABR5ADN1_9BACL|nr:hypothetical protein [Paenibacillus sp. VKM B-2647]KIL39161.1 hypothetical protein SD70_21660 [Paenibacillus sp. VKM B-2647]
MLKRIWRALTDKEQPHKEKEPKEYRKLEIEATIKCYVSDIDRPFRLHMKVLDKGSFFTKDIFIKNADERARYELFYNYSTLGMGMEELERYGATDDAEYCFATLEEAKKVKEATAQYIRFLSREHQESVKSKQKIS